MPGSVRLRFLVLGPVEACAGGRAVQLGGAQQRLLLAALLARANSVVSADSLSDILWRDAVAVEASTRLAKAVYRLRSTFAASGVPGCVVTRPPGYELSVPADGLDSTRFERLLAEAQGLLIDEPRRALDRLDEALGLWRGPAWADVADHEFIQPAAARLEGLRAVAVEERGEALLALGRHLELVPQVEAVARQYPLRERPRAQLMTALHRCGRQADAVAVYRTFRRYLLDEVGLEPSPELRRLEQDILQGRADIGSEPGRSRPTAAAGSLAPGPPSHDRFVGRRSDLNWLEVLFARALVARQPVLAILSGATGTGKTSLVRAFARQIRARGGHVLSAGFHAGLSEAPILTEEFVPAVTGPLAAAARPRAAGWDGVLAGLGRDEPVLLVLDDLDTARDGALLLKQARSAQIDAPLLVVGICRTPDAGLIEDGGVAERTLLGLRRADVAELLSAVSGLAASAELLESVCAETGGLPGLVAAVGARLRDLDVAARADRAVARAEAARRGWDRSRAEIAEGVRARGQLARGYLAGDLSRDTGPVADSAWCPYKGLAAFDVADAALFAGRERLVADLLSRLMLDRFLAVVGPSGSGKSSLMAAGLMPALASGALPGSERWSWRLIRPGARPISALAAAFETALGEPAEMIATRLRADPDELAAIAGAAMGEAALDARLVLVVDQFEELFTVCGDRVERANFVRALVHGPELPGSRLIVAVVIRADFYGACADHPELAGVLGRWQVLVSAMTDAELRRAVTQPARLAGLAVEDMLVEQIVGDAAGEPGALPLVSTALLETWIRRVNGTLTLAAYTSAGGVRGAVGRLADRVFNQLDDDGRATTRRIFLRLADPESDRADTRRRAQPGELVSTNTGKAVLAALIDGRLLTAADGSVEVAHESLLREWPRLRGWLDEDRDGRRLHRRLADAALAWQADQRDDAGLFRGARLDAARDWAATHANDANRLEAEFLAASESAQQRVLQAARRSARRLRVLAASLAVLLAVAAAAGALALAQRTHARHEAAVATSRELQAEISRIAALASTLPDARRDLALLLGVHGVRLQPSDESMGGLQAALTRAPPQLARIIRYPSATYLPHLDHTGRYLAVADATGVAIENVATGAVVNTLQWPRPREYAVLSGDDRMVAAGGFDGQIAIWDIATGKLSGTPLRVGGTISYAVFDPTNPNRVYTFTNTGVLTTWDRDDPQHPHQVGPPRDFAVGDGSASSATINRDGTLLAVGPTFGGPVTVYDLRRGTTLGTYSGSLGNFAPDGTTVPIAFDDRTVLYDARTGRQITTIPTPTGGGWPNAVLSDDGRRIALAIQIQHAFAVRVFDVASGRAVGAPLELHDNAAIPVGFLPDGTIMTSGNNEAAIWSIGRTLPPDAAALPEHAQPVAFLGTHEVITVDPPSTALTRRDASTGRTVAPLPADLQQPIAPNPNGTLIAAPERAGTGVGIWDLASGQRLARLPGLAPAAQLAWSPDGRQLVTYNRDGLELWNTTDPKHPRHEVAIKQGVQDLQPDALLYGPSVRRSLLIPDSQNNLVTVVDLTNLRVQSNHATTDLALAQVAWSPDGNTVAVDSGDAGKGRLTLHDVKNWRTRKAIELPSYGGVAYVNGGRWLVVTASVTPSGAQLYDASTLQSIGSPFPLPALTTVIANSTGTKFVETNADQAAIWVVDPTQWITAACHIAGRNLTKAEWDEYLPGRPYRKTCPEWPVGQ